MSRYALPRYRQEQFRKFLRARDISDCTATTANKIEWLLLVIAEKSIAHNTLMYYVTGLEDFGPQRASERAEQAALVRAYGLELRNNRNLLPPAPPARAMDASIFEALILELSKPRCHRNHEFRQMRFRIALKIMWATGLRPMEIRHLQRGWLTRCEAGYVLRCWGKWRRQNRILLMPKNPNKLLCPVSELDVWLKLVPKQSYAFVVPKTDGPNVRWHEPIGDQDFQDRFKAAISQIGLKGRYTLKSLHLSFRKRVRDKHGMAAAFILSGLSQPYRIYQCLRQEPDWSKVRSLLEDR